MDLYAYSQIEDLEEIAKANNIECPRLRGYRLMKGEEPIDVEHIRDDEFDYYCCEDLCRDMWTDFLSSYYTDKATKTVRWDRIHGWKRKTLKTYIHNQKQAYKRQYEMWNKYVGRDDILYIHSRIGGGNWEYYKDKVLGQPWYIEKIDDASDRTYCDIYARIEIPVEK